MSIRYFNVEEIENLGETITVNKYNSNSFSGIDRKLLMHSLEIDYPIYFDNVRITSNTLLWLSFVKSKFDIHFHYCTFESDCIFLDFSLKNIFFVSCSFETSRITFENSIFCNLNFILSTKEVLVNVNNSFNLNFEFSGFYIRRLNIKESKYVKVNISRSHIPVSFDFKLSKVISLFLDDVKIQKYSAKKISFKSIVLIDCSLTENIDFFPSDFKEYYEIDFINLININDKEIEFSNHSGKIRIGNFYISNSSNINFYGIDVENLMLNENCSNISLNNFYVSTVDFNSFLAIESIAFRNVISTYSGVFNINNSILKNVVFNPSFLHQFELIEVKNSSLEGLEVYNFMYIPDKCILSNKSLGEDNIGFCRELVGLMNKHNHKYYATNYNALEQNLRLESGIFNSKIDKYVLWLNKQSNNHGTKPEKAFSLIVCNFFIYFFVLNFDVLFCFGSFFKYSLYLPFDLMFENLSVFFNPLKGIKDVVYPDYSPSKLFIIWDFFYNVVYAYLVYQLIAAFRKFNKS